MAGPELMCVSSGKNSQEVLKVYILDFVLLNIFLNFSFKASTPVTDSFLFLCSELRGKQPTAIRH